MTYCCTLKDSFKKLEIDNFWTKNRVLKIPCFQKIVSINFFSIKQKVLKMNYDHTYTLNKQNCENF